MFDSRGLNSSIKNIHERALRIVYGDYNKSFKDLLELGNSVLTHQKNLQMLTTEINKTKNGINLE